MKTKFLKLYRSPNQYEQDFIKQCGPLLSKQEYERGLKLIRDTFRWYNSELNKHYAVIKAIIVCIIKKQWTLKA